MKDKPSILRTLLALVLLLLPSLLCPAQQVADKAVADSLYESKNYAAAAEQYALLADSLEAPDVYYNLGNAEYKLKHYAQAVLAYERALRLDPDNEDAQYNVTLVRTRLADRFARPSEMFFFSWLRTWVGAHSVGHWTLWSFFWLAASFLFLILYITRVRMWLRKTGFFAALFCFLCFLVTTTFALVQRATFSSDSAAIVLADEVQLYASPTTSSKAVRVLHEGTRVEILDATKDGWLQVELFDGNTAFLKNKADSGVILERINPSARQK